MDILIPTHPIIYWEKLRNTYSSYSLMSLPEESIYTCHIHILATMQEWMMVRRATIHSTDVIVLVLTEAPVSSMVTVQADCAALVSLDNVHPVLH